MDNNNGQPATDGQQVPIDDNGVQITVQPDYPPANDPAVNQDTDNNPVTIDGGGVQVTVQPDDPPADDPVVANSPPVQQVPVDEGTVQVVDKGVPPPVQQTPADEGTVEVVDEGPPQSNNLPPTETTEFDPDKVVADDFEPTHPGPVDDGTNPASNNLPPTETIAIDPSKAVPGSGGEDTAQASVSTNGRTVEPLAAEVPTPPEGSVMITPNGPVPIESSAQPGQVATVSNNEPVSPTTEIRQPAIQPFSSTPSADSPTISDGEGFTHLIMKLRPELSPQQAYGIYKSLESEFAELDGAYFMNNGEMGIRNPGQFNLPDDLRQRIMASSGESVYTTENQQTNGVVAGALPTDPNATQLDDGRGLAAGGQSNFNNSEELDINVGGNGGLDSINQMPPGPSTN